MRIVCQLFLVLSLSSCLKDEINQPSNVIRNADDVVVDLKKPVWQIDISEDLYADGNLIPQRFERTITIAGSKDDKNTYILGVDIFTGEEQFKWFKDYDSSGMDFYDVEQNQRENLILLPDYNNIFLFDIQSGKVVWRNIEDKLIRVDNVILHNNNFYFSGGLLNDSGIYDMSLFEGDFRTGEIRKLNSPTINPNQLFSFAFGSVSGMAIFGKNDKLYSFFSILEYYDVYTSRNLGYVGLYNITDKKYEYEREKVGDTIAINFSIRPVLFDNTAVVNADNEIFGIELKTGKTIWNRNEFEKNGSGTFIMGKHNEQLIAINKDGFASRILSINPQTGVNNWEILGEGGHVENFQILDNKLFFVSRGTAELYVYDLDTKKLLVKMKTPDVDKFNAYGGMKPFLVDGKLMLVVCSYLNAFCYDLSFLLN